MKTLLMSLLGRLLVMLLAGSLAACGGGGGDGAAAHTNGTVVTPEQVVLVQAPSGPILEGNSVSLVASASTTIGAHFQWTLDGRVIGGDSSILYIAATKPADSGNYTVKMTSASGGASSATLNLVVSAAPAKLTILKSYPAPDAPTTQIIVEGTGFTSVVSVQLDGIPATIISLTEQRIVVSKPVASNVISISLSTVNDIVTSRLTPADGQTAALPVIVVQPASIRLQAGKPATLSVQATGTGLLQYQWKKDGVTLGENSTSLQFKAVSASDVGNYTVTVSNQDGSVTSQNASVTLETQVGMAPLISVQPPDTSINAGQTLNLAITVSGDGPIHYQWKKGTASLGTDASQLSISNAQVADSGNYAVVVSSPYGSDVSNIAVVKVNAVAVAAGIVIQPENLTVNAGQTVGLSVGATGTGPLHYQWKKAGVPVGGDASNLSIANAQVKDAGTYTVTVTNQLGSVESKVVTVNVVAASGVPVIVLQPMDLLVTEGDSVTMTAVASSDTPVHYLWKKSGVTVGIDASIFSINKVQASDGGVYTVTMSNSAGNVVSRNATLTVKSASGLPALSGFTPAGGNAATVVTISGSGFTGTSSVRFNGLSASYTVVSDTQISATAPAGVSSGNISISNAMGSTSSKDAFIVGNALTTLALNVSNVVTAGFSFSVTNNANSTGYYQVLADSVASPTPENLKRNGTAFSIIGNLASVQRIASLLPSTQYNLHFIALDANGLLQPAIRTLPVQTSRDPLKWPFSSDSIWNMPIGRNAIYSHANLPAVFGQTTDETFYFFISGNDDDYLFLNPAAPLTNVYLNTAAWQTQAAPHTTGINRCYNRDPVNDVISSTTTSTLLVTVPMPADYIVPSTRGNNGGAFLMPDGRTFKQIQPIARCNAGEPATSLVYIRQPSDENLYGTGISGAHGGSKLSTIGGTLRLGELRPNQPAPRHVLKLDVDSRVVFPKCSNTSGGGLPPCFRWPAQSADSGASNPADMSSYGYLAQANVNPAMSMGALLALPASLSIDSLHLETEPGRQLAWTLQNYGAYIVDSTGFPSYYFGTESGPDGSFTEQFKRDWGYDFLQRTYTDAERTRRAGLPTSSSSYASVESTKWLHDMQKIITSLQVVTNNSASNVGGGGARLQPLAAEIRP